MELIFTFKISLPMGFALMASLISACQFQTNEGKAGRGRLIRCPYAYPSEKVYHIRKGRHINGMLDGSGFYVDPVKRTYTAPPFLGSYAAPIAPLLGVPAYRQAAALFSAEDAGKDGVPVLDDEDRHSLQSLVSGGDAALKKNLCFAFAEEASGKAFVVFDRRERRFITDQGEMSVPRALNLSQKDRAIYYNPYSNDLQ